MKLHDLLNELNNIDGVILPDNIEKLLMNKLESKKTCEKEKENEDNKNIRDKILDSQVPLPYLKDYKYTGCKNLKSNHKLFTPCCQEVYKDGFCKLCIKNQVKYGLLENRNDKNFKALTGESPVHYGNVLEKLKITSEEVHRELLKYNQTIIPSELLSIKKKRGRKPKSVVVNSSDEETNELMPEILRGRPKETVNECEIMDDRIESGELLKDSSGKLFMKLSNGEIFDLTGKKAV